MKKAIIYTTPTCPYCTLAKKFLEKLGVEVEEIDVSRNREKLIEMIVKSGQMGVPVIEINGEIIVGFDVERIKKALQK